MTNNQGTKDQIRRWIEESIRKAQNPDPRELLKKEREKRKSKVAKHYGL